MKQKGLNVIAIIGYGHLIYLVTIQGLGFGLGF